jgi:hypothetical protein
MKNQPSNATRYQRLKQVATNLFRSERTGAYYGIFKRKGEQVKRSVREFSKRRRGVHRQGVEWLNSDSVEDLPFSEYDKAIH